MKKYDHNGQYLGNFEVDALKRIDELEAELKKYRDAEAEEARIQNELEVEHERIKAQPVEEVIGDLIKNGYSREELEEMAESTKAAIDWYMSAPAACRGWLFAYKAGRRSVQSPPSP